MTACAAPQPACAGAAVQTRGRASGSRGRRFDGRGIHHALEARPVVAEDAVGEPPVEKHNAALLQQARAHAAVQAVALQNLLSGPEAAGSGGPEAARDAGLELQALQTALLAIARLRGERPGTLTAPTRQVGTIRAPERLRAAAAETAPKFGHADRPAGDPTALGGPRPGPIKKCRERRAQDTDCAQTPPVAEAKAYPEFVTHERIVSRLDLRRVGHPAQPRRHVALVRVKPAEDDEDEHDRCGAQRDRSPENFYRLRWPTRSQRPWSHKSYGTLACTRCGSSTLRNRPSAARTT